MSVSAARSLPWFARHEARLTWRDIMAMMTAGRRGR
jgi:ABC-2 type transport system permease protein